MVTQIVYNLQDQWSAACNLLFLIMDKHLRPTTETFDLLMAAWLNRRNPHAMKRIYIKMVSRGIRPGARAYRCLLAALLQSWDWDGAWLVLMDAEQAHMADAAMAQSIVNVLQLLTASAATWATAAQQERMQQTLAQVSSELLGDCMQCAQRDHMNLETLSMPRMQRVEQLTEHRPYLFKPSELCKHTC
jgi:pentatricopeptide repeat protein